MTVHDAAPPGRAPAGSSAAGAGPTGASALDPASPATPTSPTAHGRRDRRWLALSVLAISQLMIVLDATIVNVALPAVQEDLGFSTADLAWVVNGYTLAFGGFLLLGGRLADRFGRRRVFLAGALLFAMASLLGGFAQSQELLIAARALQGLGGAVMSPAALSLVTVIFAEGKERDRALGVWAGISAGGAAIGLILGGVLTEYTSWRWVLFVNVPIALGGVIAARALVPESRDEHAKGFDVAGAVTATGGLVAVVYALVRGNELGWTSTQTLLTAGFGLGLLAVFVVLQRVQAEPLVPGRLFRTSSAAGADISALLIGAAIFAIFFFLTLYLQILQGYSPIRAGFAFLPMTLMIGVSAGIASNLLGRVGPRRLLVTGMLIAASGLLSLVRLSPDSSYVGTVLPGLLLVAAGMGLAFVSLTSAAVAGVPPEDSGIASALLNSGQQVGGAVGLALITAVSTARFEAVRPPAPQGPPSPEYLSAVQYATTSGWAWGFSVGAAILLVGAVVALLTVRVSKEDAAKAAASGAAVAA